MLNLIDIRTHRGALGMLLYSVSFPENRDISVWSKEIESYYIKMYGVEKIKTILDSIKYYFLNIEIDLSTIVPTDLSIA